MPSLKFLCKARDPFLLGLFIFVLGFLYDILFAGIPYQDPSPDMQQRYDFHSAIAAYIRMSGGCIALLSGCLACLRVLRIRKNKREVRKYDGTKKTE